MRFASMLFSSLILVASSGCAEESFLDSHFVAAPTYLDALTRQPVRGTTAGTWGGRAYGGACEVTATKNGSGYTVSLFTNGTTLVSLEAYSATVCPKQNDINCCAPAALIGGNKGFRCYTRYSILSVNEGNRVNFYTSTLFGDFRNSDISCNLTR